VTVEGPLTGGVIAAGDGRRLRDDGWTMPKPMVPVAGVPLLEVVVGNFLGAGITPITVIVNERERECVGWAHARFPGADLRFLVKTTASSLESFVRVAAVDRPGPMLISTVDAWCRPADFARFVAAARRRPPGAMVLGVTPLVADEKPLWVESDGDGRVRRVGGPSGHAVTAGLYLVPEGPRHRAAPAGLGRLREYLAWLVDQGEPVYAESIETIVDVDRTSDVALAESLARAEQTARAEDRGASPIRIPEVSW
jgi:NDP-sugar pyrophosphorylase family protein